MQWCAKCRTTYDFENNSATCPHQGFPENEKCEEHGRVHCGHAECIQKIKDKMRKAVPGPTEVIPRKKVKF